MQMADWIGEVISNSFWEAVTAIIENALDFTFTVIEEVIILPTDATQFLPNFNQYLSGVQFFAGGLLVIFVIWSVFKQLSGVMYNEEKSMGSYFINVTIAGALIYILPQTVSLVFIPLNNALIRFITSIGIDTTRIEDSMQSVWGYAKEERIIGFMFLILVLALIVLSIAGAIRYIETIIAILIAPLAAISLINNSDALNVWLREVTAIVFTQTIHVLLLQILLSIMGGVSNMFLMLMLSIGAIAVGLRGPQILRQYLYKTGTSSALVSSAGTVSRLGMIGILVKK